MDAYDRLRETMRRRGITQLDLAGTLGVHPSLVCRALRRRTGLARHWPAICRHLGTTADWLLFGRGKGPTKRVAEEQVPYDAGGEMEARLVLAPGGMVPGEGDLVAAEGSDGRRFLGTWHCDDGQVAIAAGTGTVILPREELRSVRIVEGWCPGT